MLPVYRNLQIASHCETLSKQKRRAELFAEINYRVYYVNVLNVNVNIVIVLRNQLQNIGHKCCKCKCKCCKCFQKSTTECST